MWNILALQQAFRENVSYGTFPNNFYKFLYLKICFRTPFLSKMTKNLLIFFCLEYPMKNLAAVNYFEILIAKGKCLGNV